MKQPNLKVKRESLDAARRTQAVLDLTRDRKAQSPIIPEPVARPDGFTSYVRRLERRNLHLQLLEQPALAGAPRARGDARQGGLGNNTKSQAALWAKEHEKDEEYQHFTLCQTRREYVESVPEDQISKRKRQARFSAQNSATKLLAKLHTPRDGQWRVTGCNRRKIADGVQVLYSAEQQRAYFGNLMICGSVWTCPVCASKISDGRKNEIESAFNLHTDAGGSAYMVTLTFSHQREDDLGWTMQRFQAAREDMRAHRKYKELKVFLGYVGDIRALEVTYGDKNGWHPHEHGLWLVADRWTREKLRKAKAVIFEVWHWACCKNGLAPPNRKRGVDIRAALSPSEYLAKFGREQHWGASSELAKQHIKTGKAESATPFDLLRSYEAGNSHHGALFLVYAKTFFGKRQVVWSKGLKRIFGIKLREDQEIAEREDGVDVEQAGKLSAYEWRVILHQPYDVRVVVLDLVESGWANLLVPSRSVFKDYVRRDSLDCLSIGLQFSYFSWLRSRRNPFTPVRRYLSSLVARTELVPF